jgi:hypothetical protein
LCCSVSATAFFNRLVELREKRCNTAKVTLGYEKREEIPNAG